jgi:hypothetical protein
MVQNLRTALFINSKIAPTRPLPGIIFLRFPVSICISENLPGLITFTLLFTKPQCDTILNFTENSVKMTKTDYDPDRGSLSFSNKFSTKFSIV